MTCTAVIYVGTTRSVSDDTVYVVDGIPANSTRTFSVDYDRAQFTTGTTLYWELRLINWSDSIQEGNYVIVKSGSTYISAGSLSTTVSCGTCTATVTIV